MVDAKSPQPTDQQRLTKIEIHLADALHQIKWMQKLGGFTDAKTLSVRAKRMEDRIEVLERDAKMLLDVIGIQASLLEHALADHLHLNLNTSNAPAVILFRKTRRRLGEWAEACKLKTRRADIADVRMSENRIRPREVAAHS